ncbi:hypothetical protein R3Q06_08885 [Rhodococcus erythropolis]|uniref:TetR/AcrR family transcriptional regulator n=1 Tax=Rhodococcus erythropolis TaxID=1833 RepID=UPI002948EDD0|nr:hypothetical protein [Rhodococcus erythropolis]MDV6273612.1 hypothetical protein [Rhodococcus erythropolis]
MHAASYRRIAAQADVPLGSTTYYFSDLETLIVNAFETLRDALEPRYADPVCKAQNPADVVDALVAATCGPTAPTFDDSGSSPLLSDDSARAVDALMWGWWSYRALHADRPLVCGVTD